MSESKQEEIIAALWLIAGLTALGHGFIFFGWLCIVKAAFDTVFSICYGVKEVFAEKDATGTYRDARRNCRAPVPTPRRNELRLRVGREHLGC